MQNIEKDKISKHHSRYAQFAPFQGAGVAEDQRQRSLPAPQHATGCALLREGYGGGPETGNIGGLQQEIG